MLAYVNPSKLSTHAHHLTPFNHHFNNPPFFLATSFQPSNHSEPRKWSLKCTPTKNNSEILSVDEELGEEKEQEGKRRVYNEIIEEREVVCQVEVVSWRERRIKAEIEVYAHVQKLWDVLTDYDRLAQFIPNLVTCKRVPCPHPGRIWLEQRGLQRALYWKIEALVLLELQEFFNSEYERKIHFSLVEGDFEKFEGIWSLKTEMRSQSTTLSYEVTVVPKFKIPAIILEKVIRAELPANLLAMARRAESDSGDNSFPE